jgi:ribosomal protein L6P/L9E
MDGLMKKIVVDFQEFQFELFHGICLLTTLVVGFEMKDIYKDEDFDVPEGVTIDIKSRLVTVKGPRGELTKSLRHIDMEIRKVNDRKIKLIVWHGGRKHVACLRTVRSLISNMINGVTKVLFSLKMY